MILAEPRHEPKVRQGVTTEVIGDRRLLLRAVPVARGPPALHRAELRARRRPAAAGALVHRRQYLAMFDEQVAVNICYLLGNSPLRIAAVGWDDRPATPAELANMKALLREAMEEGAWGMSTGLDYPPGNYADTAELIELSPRGGAAGRDLPHARPLPPGRPVPRPVQRGARDRPPAAASPSTSPTSTSARTSRGGAERMLGLVEDARETRGWTSPSTATPIIYGSTRLLILFPRWAHDGGPERAARRSCADPDARARLREEIAPARPQLARHVADVLQAARTTTATRATRSPRWPR